MAIFSAVLTWSVYELHVKRIKWRKKLQPQLYNNNGNEYIRLLAYHLIKLLQILQAMHHACWSPLNVIESLNFVYMRFCACVCLNVISYYSFRMHDRRYLNRMYTRIIIGCHLLIIRSIGNRICLTMGSLRIPFSILKTNWDCQFWYISPADGLARITLLFLSVSLFGLATHLTCALAECRNASNPCPACMQFTNCVITCYWLAAAVDFERHTEVE